MSDGGVWGSRGNGRGGGRGGRGDRGRGGARGGGGGGGGGRAASNPSVVRDGNLNAERPGPAPAWPGRPAAASVSAPQFQERREPVTAGEAPRVAGSGGGEFQGSRGSRGGGRGEAHGERGRGAEGGGRRGARRERFTQVERMDVVASKPAAYTGGTGKKGQTGHPSNLVGNFFTLLTKTDWCIFNYRVDFKPDEERTHIKKGLLKPHAASIGAYIFDGSSLYVAQRLHPNPMKLYSIRETDKEKIELSVRLVQQLTPGDVMYLQFFNITVRKCLSAMKLEELGRHFYDRERGIKMAALKLELWPGYITSLRNYENNVLLCVEVTHKVLRQETVLDVISQMKGNNRYPLSPALKKTITDELVGTIVMTHYNRKTYRIDDIDWDSTPSSSFDMKGEKTSYADYYLQRYQQRVVDMHQPMLVSRPKKRDFHRGMTGPIILVPEFCQMTGLSDAMRSNFNMMKELSQHLHMGPKSRMDAITNFMRRLKSTPEVKEDLEKWGMEFSNNLVSFKGRVLPPEEICFGEKRTETPNRQADWTMAFRSKPLLQTKDLLSWVIIVPSRDASGVDNLVSVMQQVSRPLKFNISNPKEIITIPNIQIQNYVRQIDQAVANYEKQCNLQLIFVILPNNKLDTYAAVKRKCIVDYGITSQCYLAKNVQKKPQLMAIATKCVVQMSAKLGGEPWQIQNPFQSSGAMVVGFDVYHCGKRTGASVGAMVATTSPTLAKYYSTVSFHSHREELSANVSQDIAKCVLAYEGINNALPGRIIMYRDGVGEGQLSYVYGTELGQIKTALKALYEAREKPLPKFTFIVVTKKMNTRIFTSPNSPHGTDNPEPGTIVDDVITLPERYDFYLISQSVKQGTVSPTSYNVLHDEQGLKPDQIQRFTYKMCHLYFNWSGTVGVPAPCQYAHKLAYLTGLALGNAPNERLSHLLYYL